MCVQELSLRPTPTPNTLESKKERKHIWEALGDKVAQFILLSVSIIIKNLNFILLYLCYQLPNYSEKKKLSKTY